MFLRVFEKEEKIFCLYTKLREVLVKGLDPIRIVKANKNLWEIELFLHEWRINILDFRTEGSVIFTTS